MNKHRKGNEPKKIQSQMLIIMLESHQYGIQDVYVKLTLVYYL